MPPFGRAGYQGVDTADFPLTRSKILPLSFTKIGNLYGASEDHEDDEEPGIHPDRLGEDSGEFGQIGRGADVEVLDDEEERKDSESLKCQRKLA